jgi:hypothetical protein
MSQGQREERPAYPQSAGQFLKHVKSGLYVQPEGKRATIGVRLVLQPGPHRNSADLKFDIRPDGSIIHVASGLAVHPVKESSGAELVLLRDSPERRCQFTHDSTGGFFYLRNGSSRFHVHPSAGKASPGVFLMLHPDGPAKAFKGELEYASASVFSSEFLLCRIARRFIPLLAGTYLSPNMKC